MSDALLEQAAEAIATADALLIGAGAGMGVDSGLPDFRGDQGFWKAYPAFAKLGLNFVALANPRLVRTDPELAWGFYGHRLNLYRQTTPHPGFQILRKWAERMRLGHFVYTSNVNGQFQRAGFSEEQLVEGHGTSAGCSVCTLLRRPGASRRRRTVAGRGGQDHHACMPPLPACPKCGGLARPNVLMFGDAGWDESRSWQQERASTAGGRRCPSSGWR